MTPSSWSIRSIATWGGIVAEALFHPGFAEFAEIVFGRLLNAGRLERGELPLAEVEALVVVLDQLGDPDRGGERLLVTGERLVHLLGASDVELVVLEPHPVGVVEGPPGVDAQEDVVDLGVFLEQVMGVAGGDEGQAHPPGEVGGAACSWSFWIWMPLHWIST